MTRPARRRGWRAALSRRGMMASELALVAPLFFLVLLATADLIRVFRAQIRLEMIAVQIGQIASQCSAITTPGDTDQFWQHAARIAGGLIDINSPNGGAMIISAVSNQSNANRLNWRVRTGNVMTTGIFGNIAIGGSPTIRGKASASFTVPSGQTLFVTEVYAIVQPWTLSAGLIGTAVSNQLTGLTMFLSRASDPTKLQTAPTAATTRNCTA